MKKTWVKFNSQIAQFDKILQMVKYGVVRRSTYNTEKRSRVLKLSVLGFAFFLFVFRVFLIDRLVIVS